MRIPLSCLAGLLVLTACSSPPVEPEWGRPLPAGAHALMPLGPDEQPPPFRMDYFGRRTILPALARSLTWMDKPSSKTHFPIAGVDWRRTRDSLARFAELLGNASSPDEFERQVQAEFQWYKSAGWDGRGGGVLFTGYCTPILEGSLQRSERYRWPLYARPADLVKDKLGTVLGQRTASGGLKDSYPTRQQIERSQYLKGTELAWMANPMDAYIAHVNGSAVVRLPDDSLFRLGFAGHNGHEYTSLRQMLVDAGKLDGETAGLAAIRAWAERNPSEVERFLHRNDRYVFFLPIDGNPHGSLDVEVSAKRTIATDKSLFPRAALTYVHARLPDGTERGKAFHHFMLDQDTGGAIRTAGRADIYLGIGDEAEALAGSTKVAGQLYYLFLEP